MLQLSVFILTAIVRPNIIYNCPFSYQQFLFMEQCKFFDNYSQLVIKDGGNTKIWSKIYMIKVLEFCKPLRFPS